MAKIVNKDFNDFEVFDDNHEGVICNDFYNLDTDQYGDDFDPNSDKFYDLDVFSVDYAKSLFNTLGDNAKYKGFNLTGHKCREGVKLGCTEQEYEQYQRLQDRVTKGYMSFPFSFTDNYNIPPELEALNLKLETLKDKCLFGVCEACTEEEYSSYKSQYMNHVNDEPLDLYHKNNQTILDPLTMPDWPVDPKLFVKKVKSELKAKKVFVSDDMPELLEKMCRLFNFSIKPNKELPRTVRNLVFPAQTGIGKSVSVQVFVSMLAKHSSLIVVPKVEEAISYCKYINKLAANDDLARCYYALTDKNKDDLMRVDASKLCKYSCIVITHNMFRRVNGFDSVDHFAMFGKNPRDFISIDEKLSFHQPFQLDYKELDQLIENVEEALEQIELLNDIPTSHNALSALKKFKDLILFKEDKIVTNDSSLVVKENLKQDVIDELNKIGETVKLSLLSVEGKIPVKLIDLKNKLKVEKLLRTEHYSVQVSKRDVIGVSLRDLDHIGDDIGTDMAPFYRERFDPPIHNFLPYSDVNRNPDIICNCIDLTKCSCDFTPNFDDLCEEDNNKIVNIIKTRNDQRGLELVTSVVEVILRTRVDETLAILEKLGANKNKVYRQNILNNINVKLEAIRYFAKNNFLIYKANNKKALLATETLVNKLGLSVVLDATAQFNEYYQLANRFLGHVGFVNTPQIRQYKNLTIYKAKGFNQSRTALYRNKTNEELMGIAKSYATYVINELQEKDKLLVICHKNFVSAIKTQIGDRRVEFTHWGNHIGKNDWSHCNKVVLIGWNYLPPEEHVCTINSALDSVLLTSRHLNNELIEKFSVSQLADDIVQGLMRSRARVISTEQSDCKPTNFYIFYKDDSKSQQVLDLVESQFPFAKIIDWTPNGKPIPKTKTKRNKKDDEVIDFLVLKAKDHETYLRKDLQDELGINKSTMGRIIDRDYFREQLEVNGIVYKSKDGKSQQFILK